MMSEPKYELGELLRHRGSGRVVVVGEVFAEGATPFPGRQYGIDVDAGRDDIDTASEGRLDLCFERVKVEG